MLSEQVKELEYRYNEAEKLLCKYDTEVQKLKQKIKEYEDLCKMVIPNQVYTHKERRNTTVKFLDGSQITVTRRKGDKNCIETAIAYCIMKQILSAENLKKLIERREEH